MPSLPGQHGFLIDLCAVIRHILQKGRHFIQKPGSGLAANLTLHHKPKMIKIHPEATEPQPTFSHDKRVPTLGCEDQSPSVPVWMWRGFLCPVIDTWTVGVNKHLGRVIKRSHLFEYNRLSRTEHVLTLKVN